MTQSAEYPDLKWMAPKSWTNANRTSVQLVVIHDTEGSEVASSAEDGAAYDQRRDDGTSTHFFHDQNSTVQCVRTEDQAHAARAQGNRRGIQHELCGRASQGAAGWADPASEGTLRQAAKQVARDCKKWGIPARKLTPTQVAGGVKGICGHADITKAFPQDNGTHTDPGPTFPWTKFMSMVQAQLALGEIVASVQVAGFDTAAETELKTQATKGVLSYNGGGLPIEGDAAFLPAATGADGKPVPANVLNYLEQMFNQVAEIHATITAAEPTS
jgi:N-acetyl-anhydromuramyl-L-alanine amidase AmpD